ncbi:uncharacterized protein LOC131432029 isoform X1 [Malaya genurostris]|uniref:uncharacterized protein LOC131432029 isoform X1 n=2 Tax=Malaya genurostris TaxID=325434 RepID=UPI0026F3E933|nr:uncharacterized protein LOC131432029 isoform X1 [Malaya genurostris]
MDAQDQFFIPDAVRNVLIQYGITENDAPAIIQFISTGTGRNESQLDSSIDHNASKEFQSGSVALVSANKANYGSLSSRNSQRFDDPSVMQASRSWSYSQTPATPKINCFVGACTRCFNVATTYIEHLKNEHRIPNNYRITCTYCNSCDLVFLKFYSFKRHVFNHKFIDHSPICCEKSFKNADVNHYLTCHSNESMKNTNEHDVNSSHLADETVPSIILNFLLNLHKRNNLTRSDVKSIVANVQEIHTNIANCLRKLPILFENDESALELQNFIEKLVHSFDSIDSDYKFISYLEMNNLYKPPIIHQLKTDEMKTHYTAITDIEFQLKTYFESYNVFNKTVQYMCELEKSGRISNFVNGSTWKRVKMKYPHDTVLPLSFYTDEFEINDNLSSHNKRDVVCGMYYTCLTTPIEYSSKLSNIFVAGVMKKVTISKLGVNALIASIVDKFKRIEENGVEITTEGQTRMVKFVLVLVQGDNLGIHTMLMFSNSFNANFYCRFCKRHRDLMEHDCDEYIVELRTIENYEEDVKINDLKCTGIKGESEFNKLPSFHVILNQTVDAMHDYFSNGILKYGFTNVLNYIVFSKSFLTISQLNASRRAISKHAIEESLARMPDFDYVYDSVNKKKTIRFRTTASEMRTFCYYFTFIVGPFVPFGDPVWEYAKLLVVLVELVLAPSFSLSDIEKLKACVHKHNLLYQEIFGEVLKPKHHFSVHYASVILKSGPISKMMTFRQEAKHKIFKQYAHVTSSRKNICYTICVKACLQFSHDAYNNNFFKSDFETSFEHIIFKNRSYFKNLVMSNCINIDSDNIFSTYSCKIYGTRYRNGLYLTTTLNCVTELLEIVEILKITDNIYIVCQLWECGQFDEHFLAFEVIRRIELFKVLPLKDFDGSPITVHSIKNKVYYRKKYNYVDDISEM